MNFLVDENVGNSVVLHLKNKKHNIIIASQKELLGREDSYLLNIAFKEHRIVITNDKDFGYLVYRQKMPSRGGILFRFAQEEPSLKIEALDTILSLKPDQIRDHFIIASEGKIRIRPLK